MSITKLDKPLVIGGKAVYPQTSADQVIMSDGTPLEIEGGGILTKVLDLVYPIGSIYMSVNSTSPADLFGGTWEQIKDTFLLSAGDSYSAGSSGGEVSHSHTLNNGHAYIDSSGNILVWKYKNGLSTWTSGWGITTTSGQQQNIDRTSAVTLGGSTDNSNNMPPYLAVYCWKRVS